MFILNVMKTFLSHSEWSFLGLHYPEFPQKPLSFMNSILVEAENTKESTMVQ